MNIILYLQGAMIVSSLMMWWFNTNLPIHVVQLLKYFGYKRNNEAFWASSTPIELWTNLDLADWKQRHIPAWLDELTECPGCLSNYISFVTAIGVSCLCSQSPAFFILAWLGWPYISNVALAVLKKLQRH
jgi:hypothetical protein